MANEKHFSIRFMACDPIATGVIDEINTHMKKQYDGFPAYMKPTTLYTEGETAVKTTPSGLTATCIRATTGDLLGIKTPGFEYADIGQAIDKGLMLGYQENDVQMMEKAYNAFKTRFMPAIKDVIYHDPAVIVLWKDGTKTVAKASGEDKFSPEIGLAMAIAKKVTGNYENFEALLPHEPVKVEAPPKKQMKHWGVRYIYNKNVEGRTNVDAYTEKAAGNIVRMRVAHDARCSADDVHIMEVKESSGRYAWADVPANEKTTSTYDVEMNFRSGPNGYVFSKTTKRVQAANSTDARDQAVAWCAAEHDIPLSNISIVSILDVYDEE